MKLIALTMLLWDDENVKGRIEWDYDQLSSRTGLTVDQIERNLLKMERIRLIAFTAAGPKLTWDRFERDVLPDLRNEALLRPARKSASS